MRDGAFRGLRDQQYRQRRSPPQSDQKRAHQPDLVAVDRHHSASFLAKPFGCSQSNAGCCAGDDRNLAFESFHAVSLHHSCLSSRRFGSSLTCQSARPLAISAIVPEIGALAREGREQCSLLKGDHSQEPGLSRLSQAETRSISAENPTGARGGRGQSDRRNRCDRRPRTRTGMEGIPEYRSRPECNGDARGYRRAGDDPAHLADRPSNAWRKIVFRVFWDDEDHPIDRNTDW